MKNQGISLISLIITIIVIIILAAIVIFTGLGTPDSAQFSSFCNDVDSVYMAMIDQYGELKVEHAVANHTRTDEQIFLEIAIGDDKEQYSVMNNTITLDGSADDGVPTTGLGYQNIDPVDSYLKKEANYTLPDVRQSNEAWYVTKEGKIFNANGFVYDDKTYFNASYYYGSELKATEAAPTGGTEATDVISARAKTIAAAINGNADLKITTPMQ